METTRWQVSGNYFETCSCDYLCPCLPSSLSGRPTQGYCNAALVFHIDKGNANQVSLDGLNTAVLLRTPEEMDKGNWTVGLVVDERTTPEQRQALGAIFSGQAGGPMAALGPLITDFQGIETKPIQFEMNGLSRSVTIPGILDQAVEGMLGANQTDPIYLDNVGHPVTTRLALAKATRSHMHAFGINWDNESGQNNGHFAPFSWQSS